MKPLIMAILLLMTTPAAYAKPIIDSKAEISQASQAAVSIYRNRGGAALQQAIIDCYKEVGYATAFCVYMDAAGREIEFSVAAAYKELGQTVAPRPFFQRQAFGERTASFYILHRQTRKQANTHMQTIQPLIRKQVQQLLTP